jgi:hypothetical protein
VTALMRVHAEVFPVLGEGQRSRWRTLLEVLDGNLIGWQAQSEWSRVAEEWGRDTRRDLESMSHRARTEHFPHLRALAVEILGNGAPLNYFSLKQFRDAAEPLRACYQALLRSRTVIERIHDLRELEGRLHVAIHRYPTQPIVDLLGLAVQSRYSTPDGVVECLQPSRPFYLKADLRTEPGESLGWRAGSTRWQHPRAGSAAYFLESGPTAVGQKLVEAIDSRPQRIRDTLRIWSERFSQRLDRRAAARAVESEAEPQMVVHATLSREWEHWGNPRWYQRREQLPLFVLRRDSVGSAAPELFGAPLAAEPEYWAPPTAGGAGAADDDVT